MHRYTAIDSTLACSDEAQYVLGCKNVNIHSNDVRKRPRGVKPMRFAIFILRLLLLLLMLVRQFLHAFLFCHAQISGYRSAHIDRSVKKGRIYRTWVAYNLKIRMYKIQHGVLKQLRGGGGVTSSFPSVISWRAMEKKLKLAKRLEKKRWVMREISLHRSFLWKRNKPSGIYGLG